MSRTTILSGLPVQKQGEDGEFRPRSSSNAAPPFKRPRGRPPKDRAAIISTSKPTDVNIDGSSRPTTVLRPSSSNLRAMRSAARADGTAPGGVVQDLRHGTKRKCNQLQETPTYFQHPAYTNNTQAEVRLEEVEQRCPGYTSPTPSLQAVDSLQPSEVATDSEDAASDSDSEAMTYYTDTDSETELTTYSSVANAAAKAGGETDGATSTNDVAHKAAHPIDAKTSLDESPADVEFSQITEDANAGHQAQAVEEDSKPTDERGQIREPEVFGFAEVESQQTLTMVSISSGHSESANMKDHVRGLSQSLETIQSSEQPKPFDTTDVIEKPQDLLRTPLIQQSEQANIDNGTGDEETSCQPSSIAVRMSSDANMAGRRNRQKNVSPTATVVKKPQQLHPPGSFILIQDPHPATNAFIATALPSFLDETDPLQSPNELPSNRQRPGTAISILTGNPPPFLEPRCSPSPPTIMLQPIAISSPKYARGASALVSPQYHPLRASLSSHASRQDTMGGNPQTSLDLPGINRRLTTGFSWKQDALFQKDLTMLLEFGHDDTRIDPVREAMDDTRVTPVRKARFLYRRDLITLVPHVKHLGDKIINEYLYCLTHYTNAQNSCNMTLIGSTDPVPRELLKKLAGFSTILVPIKVHTHWLLAVLYPGHGRAKGQVKVYDSHPIWTTKVITASNVLQFLETRLGREFNPAHWILTSGQFSQSQQNDADSGLYLLGNAKSIALSLGMVHLHSNAQRMDLRWQIAQELVKRSIVGVF